MKQYIKASIGIGGTLLYSYFFWQAHWGLNLWLYSTLLIFSLLYIHPEALTKKRILLLAFATFLSGLMVVLHNSLFSKWIHIFSFFAFMGFVFENNIKSIFMGTMTGLTGFFYIPASIVASFYDATKSIRWVKKALRLTKLFVLPLVFLGIFFLMYRMGSVYFKNFSDDIISLIFERIKAIFAQLSFVYIFFLFIGVSLLIVVLGGKHSDYFAKKDAKGTNNVQRRKHALGIPRKIAVFFKMLDLKSEYRMGFIMMIMINLMLLFVNYLDISKVWTGENLKAIDNLASYVHEGTYILIGSILLSMSILLFFFRGNLNFYPNNKALKILSYVWIAQNIILVISVVIRTFQYININGLAYKRIGVLVFLLLTLYGLFSLYQKIKSAHSYQFLFQKNTTATYIVFILLCLLNWDMVIVNHNIAHPNLRSGKIDTAFLMHRDERTLAKLYENRAILIKNHSEKVSLNQRIEGFVKDYKKRQWYEWNYADHIAYKNLSKIHF